MKKVHLFAIAFLVGITAQATINHENTFASPIGDYDRYLNSQSVTFVEGGVMYQVFLNGTFNFDVPHYQAIRRNRGRRGQNIGRRSAVINTNGRRMLNHRIVKDRRGVIRSVGQTPLFYNDFGKVKNIGGIRLRYSQGRLLQVGNMQIIYNRRGRVVQTVGHINRANIIHGVGVAPVNFDAYQVTYNDPVYTGRRIRH